MKDKYRSFRCYRCDEYTSDYVVLQYKIMTMNSKEKHTIYVCNKCFEKVLEVIENE